MDLIQAKQAVYPEDKYCSGSWKYHTRICIQGADDKLGQFLDQGI